MSFDAGKSAQHVIQADIGNTGIEAESVDVGVFCLSLMGTNYDDFIREANRVVKIGGTLIVAEVSARFSDVDKFIENDTLSRRMKKNVKIALIMNEKEAGICFPTNDNEVDLSKMFYSSNPEFCEWCRDYFKYMWASSGSFQETKLKN